MKTTFTLLTAILLALGAKAETLRVTFGAQKDLAANIGSATQNKSIAAPRITVQSLDIDG